MAVFMKYVPFGLGGGGGGASSITIGTIDSQTAAANGAVASAMTLYMQSASATVPGLVNITTQTFNGVKTFARNVVITNSINDTTPGSSTHITTGNPTTLGLVVQGSITATSNNNTVHNLTGGATFIGSTLSASYSGDTWSAGGNTVASISGEGYTEFTVSNGENFMGGFGTAWSSTPPLYSNVTYGIFPYGLTGHIHIWENGGGVDIDTGINYSVGDTFRVARAGTTIVYSHNGSVVHTTTGVSATTPFFGTYVIDGAIGGGSLTGLIFRVEPAHQTSDLFQCISDDTTTVLANIDANGNIAATNLSGTNTGNITLASFGSTPATEGASLSGQALTLQPADGSHGGGVSILAQTFAGQKTFSTGLTGTLTGAASLNVLTSALGNFTATGTDGIAVTGGTGAIVGTTSIAQQAADGSHNGYLTSANWTTFNNKQATVSFSAFGSTPNSAGGGISGGAITLQPADGTNPGGVSILAQTFAGIKTFASAPVMTALTASQVVVTDSGKALASLAYASANTASAIVQRDGSGNFTAGTITATLTGAASGNLSATPSNHGMLISGAGNTVTVLAPDASTTKVWTSGGVSADPSWQTPSTAPTSARGYTNGSIVATTPTGTFTATYNNETTFHSVSSFTNLFVGQHVTGTGIPTDTVITSLNSGASTLTVSLATTGGNHAGATVTFGGALVIKLKQADGTTDPASGTGAVTVSTSKSAQTGGYNTRSITAALTPLVLSYQTTVGLQSGFYNPLFVYIVDTDGAGTMGLAVSRVCLSTGVAVATGTSFHEGTEVCTNNYYFSSEPSSSLPNLWNQDGNSVANLQDGDAVRLTGTVPSTYTSGNVYYVINVGQQGGNDYQLSATPGGSAVAVAAGDTTTTLTNMANANKLLINKGSGYGFLLLARVATIFNNGATWATTSYVDDSADSAFRFPPTGRFYASATSLSTGTALATIVWTTTDTDNKGAYHAASGTYVIQQAGRYTVSAGLGISGTFVLNNQYRIAIVKNASVVSDSLNYSGGADTQFNLGITDSVFCSVGDLIVIQACSQGTSPTIVTSNTRNYFSIVRTGDQ